MLIGRNPSQELLPCEGFGLDSPVFVLLILIF